MKLIYKLMVFFGVFVAILSNCYAAPAHQIINTATADALLRTRSNPIGGNPAGKVTIVVFLNYQCGHCIVAHTVLDAIAKKDKDIRIVYREFPSADLVSQLASRVALVAQSKNKYGVVHRALMEAAVDSTLTKDKIFAIAKKAGLNTRHLIKEMYKPAVEAELVENRQLAKQFQVAWGNAAIFVAPTWIPRVMLDASKPAPEEKVEIIELATPLDMTTDNMRRAVSQAKKMAEVSVVLQ